MCKFKVGDKVKCIDNSYQVGVLHVGKIYTVVYTDGPYVVLEGVGSNSDYTLSSNRFELGKEEPTLEEQLKVAERGCKTVTNNIDYLDEQRRDIASRISDYKSTLKVSREEVDRLKAAIEERDKPRGMVKIGDNIPAKTWLVCAGGKVAVHNRHALNSPPYVAMGNLFYDEESAKQAVHDRKIEVKLKQGK